MKLSAIKSCYLGPDISPEQFIAEHFFIFVAQGKISGYDGHRHHQLLAGGSCLVRRNQLFRYNKEVVDGRFEKIVIILEQPFLRECQRKYQIASATAQTQEVFLPLPQDPLLEHYIHSLTPYYSGSGQIDKRFEGLKREELLLILLQLQPALAEVLFDFTTPGRLDLKAFMQHNYKFNVSIERFAYLSGRSLSAFKRDFKQIFQLSPASWLTARRLDEAHFLMEHQQQLPSAFYLDLGFEDLTHFSHAFKKRFGYPPSALKARAL
ncbi:AraC family transcriptional regulator [Pokkaliibacter plantistimulans]|uniref:AraC family transcriptional regulator n=1 Tax=Proteobacteria bacterium 228 TaxID=2083153 RepID=A0A2S5KHG5_9PROT|nr:AraC family transcriptional regulator [Pokkaliibacter plantistimulans]PPC74254.1 AraC family transcriptional regulator [Pokkaliibacter plantistimulans]